MGHIRLGRLPKRVPWKDIFNTLSNDDWISENLARITANAAIGQFQELKGEPGPAYCFWILANIISATKTDNFAESLQSIGIITEGVKSAPHFLKNISQHTEDALNAFGRKSIFSNIAELSLRETLSTNVVRKSQTLFGTNLDDIQVACKSFASKKKFGQISRQFLSNFQSR